MTKVEIHHDTGQLKEMLAKRPDQIERRVRGYFNSTVMDLDTEGETKEGSTRIKTTIVGLPDGGRKIINVAFKDGVVFKDGKPKPVATYERTLINNVVVNMRYAYPDTDSNGNYYTVELVEEVVESSGGLNRKTLPGKISILY